MINNLNVEKFFTKICSLSWIFNIIYFIISIMITGAGVQFIQTEGRNIFDVIPDFNIFYIGSAIVLPCVNYFVSKRFSLLVVAVIMSILQLLSIIGYFAKKNILKLLGSLFYLIDFTCILYFGIIISIDDNAMFALSLILSLLLFVLNFISFLNNKRLTN